MLSSKWQPFCACRSVWNQCGRVMPYGTIDLNQHRLRYWLVAWWHQAITWTSVDLLSVAPFAIHITHWEWVMHICVSELTIIGADNGLSPGMRQAIIWANARILLIGPLGTILSEILTEIHIFSLKKKDLNILSGKWRPFCLSLNVLKAIALEMLIEVITITHLKITHLKTGIFLWMHPANERWHYILTPSHTGWAHVQNDPWKIKARSPRGQWVNGIMNRNYLAWGQ